VLVHQLLFCSCISAFLHYVENVALEYVAAEAEDPEEVNQEEQLQELEAAEQVEEPALKLTLLTLFRNQASPGSLTPVSYIILSFMQFSTYACAFKLIGLVWYLDACGRFVIPNSLNIPDN